MKPLFPIVVAILVLTTNAHPENIEDVKQLPQTKEPLVEAEETDIQARVERCTTCSGGVKLPVAEVHTQQSYEGCSSDKGCAGLKVKDGRVVERYGNAEAFQAAASQNNGNEFTFHPAGGLGNLLQGEGSPFWWMNQKNSPFKNAAAGGGNFEKFSKSSSSSYTTTGNGGAGLDLGANPFLNGDFSKLAGGFSGQGAGFISGAEAKPGFQSSSSFESSSFSSSSKGESDLSNNPFLNGAINKFGQSGFQAQGNFNAGAGQSQSGQAGFGQSQSGQASFGASNFNQAAFGSSSKFGTSGSGYTGSSPSPFSASTAGSNINQIQNTQKASKFDFEQQQQTQQNINEAFRQTGNVNSYENSGGDLEQACTGQGYVCVQKAQCNNGVVNTNGGSLLQANTQKQYCNTRTEICCSLQGSLGVGSTTFSGSSNQAGLFATGSQNSGQASGFNGQASGFNSQAAGTFNQNSGSFNKATSGFGQATFSGANGFSSDSFSAGSEQAGIYRPGAVGSGLKPGIPYLPPVDSSTSASNVIGSTVFVTTPRPRPTTVRPFTTPRPFVPSTAAPGYLPPQGESTINRETRLPPNPVYTEGEIILDETRQPTRPPIQFTPGPAPNEIPVGCAAALKCTPIEFCTAEGVISNTTVVLTRDQDAYRVPLTDCKDAESGRIGKCCRDPYYTDPWPTNQLGKWVPGVFGGNDGRYVPDSRGSPSTNVNRGPVVVRPPAPPVTGSILLNNVRSTEPTVGPNRVTPGFPTSTPGSFIKGGQGQYEVRDQGQYSIGGKGEYSIGGQGQYSKGGQVQTGIGGQVQFGAAGGGQTSQGAKFGQGSQFTQTTSSSYGQTIRGQESGVGVSQGVGIGVTQNVGQAVIQGQGDQGQFDAIGQAGQNQYTQTQGFTQREGQVVTQGKGTIVSKGIGQTVKQGFGQTVSQGGGQYVTQGQGFGVITGSGQTVTGGQGFGIKQGESQSVSQGAGFGIKRGQGQIVTQGQGLSVSQGQGQILTQGQGFGVTQGQGFGISQGQGEYVSQGQGQYTTQGQGQSIKQGSGFGISQGVGQGVIQGQGQSVSQGGGFGVSQGFGTTISQGQGFGFSQGQGQIVKQGQGQAVGQGVGFGISTGQGFGVNQGFGFGQKLVQGVGSGVENEYSESVQRVFLQQYSAGGQCGLLNSQKPYGNRDDLEADFGEIPWQAMVLLQTNRSLLCGGVITRPDVVVTSAACVEGLDARNVLIKGGEWKLGIDDEPLPFQIVQVKTILRHPFYQRGSLKFDAAILVLEENLRFAKNIYPICLPGSKDISLDAYYNGAGECIVTGWGKIVLQAHLKGSIMHSVNVSLISPGECESKLQAEYPHLVEQYDEESCVCAQPTNPANNICKVDIGSALACTNGDGHYVFRGVYSWDSGCQIGNQIAGFWKFDLEWYEWAIGLIESARFAQFGVGTKFTQNKYSTQINTSGVKTSQIGIKGSLTGVKEVSGAKELNTFAQGLGQFGFGSSKYTESSSGLNGGLNVGSQIKGPISNAFTATFTEKKVFQSEPKFVTYTTKPEIVTFTTKPEYFTYTTKPKLVTYTTKPEIVTFTTKPEIVTFTTKPEIVTYTTKPKIVTYTTKPQIIRYETSGSGTNPQYVAPGITFNPSFSEIVGHKHSPACKCLEGKK